MKSFLFAALAALLWGIAPIFEKIGLTQATPVIGVSIRSISVAAIMCVFIFSTGNWREIARQDSQTVLFFVISGVAAALLGQVAYFHALKEGTTASVVPVVASYPLIATMLSVGILREPLTPGKIVGVVLIVLGVISISR
ncbi:MAG: EamA family transporter [Armatimonadetes bacterium]|nr:EamA family transporter [Armatimonadota bacterium]